MSSQDRQQRDEQAKQLAEINRRNRDKNAAPPLPQRTPSSDGRSAGGVIDERFGRR